MSFRDDNDEIRDLKKPFLYTESWYRMGSRQSSIMGSSTQVLRDGSISVVLCVLIVALGPIQFGFTCGYYFPTQAQIIDDLKLSIPEEPCSYGSKGGTTSKEADYGGGGGGWVKMEIKYKSLFAAALGTSDRDGRLKKKK